MYIKRTPNWKTMDELIVNNCILQQRKIQLKLEKWKDRIGITEGHNYHSNTYNEYIRIEHFPIKFKALRNNH